MSRAQIFNKFSIDIQREFSNLKPNDTLPILIINQASIFDRDQVESFNNFTFIYSIL